jgi:hypothetical protein
MTYQEYCDTIRDNYLPLHPHLYKMREQMFIPTFLQAVRSGTRSTLQRLVREVHPQVYVFDMLAPEFCTGLLEESAHFSQWCDRVNLPTIRPNTMNNYGIVLDSIGFAPMLQELMIGFVKPLSSWMYPEVGGDSLDSHHGFTVEYEAGKDVSLDFHVDASDVTLNVCLGEVFQGGELFFRGVRCARCQETEWRDEEVFDIEHVLGRAILHRGKHRHGANPIRAGRRCNLILWCNSSRFERGHDQTRCPAWCGNHATA